MKKFIASVLFLFVVSMSHSVFSQGNPPESIDIATANIGRITNEYKNDKKGINMKDSGAMRGVYYQHINPSLFQANCFFYYAPDVNYSKVTGIHANADGYFFSGSWGSLVAGLDAERIKIKMDAGTHVYPLEEFRMENTVLFLMARTGVKVNIPVSSSFNMSVFPYAGATRETVDVDVWVNPPGPAAFTPLTKSSTTDTDWFPSWGVNTTVKVSRYMEVTAKYLGRMHPDDYMNSFTGQLNVYISRHAVISYQYKYMDISNGKDVYHLLGAGCVL